MQDSTGGAARAASATPAPGDGARLRYWTWGLPAFTAVWLAVYLVAFPEPLALAARNWPLVLVGLAGAILGNATAVGGGLVFIPALVFVWGLGPVEALKLSLVAQSVGMTSGALGWLRRGEVPLAALAPTVPPLIAGALVSTFLIRPQPLLVKGLFGPVSIAVGLLTLYLLEHRSRCREVPRAAYPGLAVVSLAGGMLTGWVAIGEGELIAAFLMLRHGLDPRRGVGLGTALLSINSILLALLHAFVLGGVPWEMAAFVMLGCAWGGRLGPFLAQWVGPHRLKIAFAAIAIADGTLFVVQFLRSLR
jgi:uncharacterized membrane protein YfcA